MSTWNWIKSVTVVNGLVAGLGTVGFILAGSFHALVTAALCGQCVITLLMMTALDRLEGGQHEPIEPPEPWEED